MKKVPTLHWQDKRSELMPEHNGIGDDLILVEDYTYPYPKGQPFKTDCNVFIINEKGWVDVSINMKRYHIVAPSISVFLNGSIIQYDDASDDLQVKAIITSDRFLKTLFQNQRENTEQFMDVVSRPIIPVAGNRMEIVQRYYQMLKEITTFHDNPYRLETAKHLTLTLFYGYSYRFHQQSDRPKAMPRSESLCLTFMELLRIHHKQHRDLQFYADKLCISEKHLSKTVKAVTGKSASRWIEDFVITESKALLYSTAKTISQIADEMGFSDQSLFGKYFKRVTGVSPKEYRK